MRVFLEIPEANRFYHRAEIGEDTEQRREHCQSFDGRLLVAKITRSLSSLRMFFRARVYASVCCTTIRHVAKS